jgi:hypothetical protein
MQHSKMQTDWTEKVKAAITDLERGGRVLEPRNALAIIDDVVEGKLDAAELSVIHGIPQDWIEATLGHVTRAVQGKGRVLPLDVEGWYAFHGHGQPYEVAPAFATAWRQARGLSSPNSQRLSFASSPTMIAASSRSKA